LKREIKNFGRKTKNGEAQLSGFSPWGNAAVLSNVWGIFHNFRRLHNALFRKLTLFCITVVVGSGIPACTYLKGPIL
jgi:hypothetical protein